MNVKYRANPRKLLETLVWIARKHPESGYHFILKALFYADKYHLQRYGRPVTGDIYIKMPNGPVASLAYDMLKVSDFLPESLAERVEAALSVERSGRIPTVTAKREPDLACFSGTDIDCLDEALVACQGKGFQGLCDSTHAEQAWIAAEMNGEMDFELFIDEDVPNREALIEYIREKATCLAL